MPTVGADPQELLQDPSQPLTHAQKIIHDTRSREAMSILPESPERVLRVVNGSASLSTRASNQSPTTTSDREQTLNLSSCNTTQPLSIAPNASRRSFQSSTAQHCSKCVDLEHKLSAEVERSRALERALEEQTHKLEQFRNWSTAKVTTLDHALQAQERLLQQVERRMAEKHDKPDIKSDYLIALQKDFVELNTRLAALESKQDGQEGEQENEDNNHDDADGQGRFRDTTHALAYAHSQSPQQRAVLGRTTPLSQVTRLLEEADSSGPEGWSQKVRAYSTPPLVVGGSRRTAGGGETPSEPGTPRKPGMSPWKPSSPANLASKLVPPSSTPGSPGGGGGSRSAPATPSRSPRPRYTSALGAKAPSPLGFRTAATPESGRIPAAFVGSNGSSPTSKTPFQLRLHP
jgi:hypothetical protein